MRWTLEFERRAEKDFGRLPAADRDRLRRFFDERLLKLDDPRALGGPLHGSLAGLWKYRVGDIRVIAELRQGQLVILVVQIGNRREVYR